MKDKSTLILLGGAALAAWFIARKLGSIGTKAATALTDAGASAGQTIFETVNAAKIAKQDAMLRQPGFIKATPTTKTGPDGVTQWNTYTCPPGYRYKKTARGEHLCFPL